MSDLWNRIMNEPALLFTALTTGYAAAVAAGWEPAQQVAIVAAAVFAIAGVLVRQNVTPTRDN